MLRLKAVHVALVVLLVVGCRYIGADGSPELPTDAPSPTALESVAPGTAQETLPATPAATPELPTEAPPTPDATPTAPPSATAQPAPIGSLLPVPVIDEPGRDDYDAFWGQFLELSCVELGMEDYWDDVAQMTREVDLVVVGRPISVEVRPDPGRYDELYLVGVAVDEVIKGSPSMAVPGVIQVRGEGDYPEETDASLPAGRTLFFLRNLSRLDYPWYEVRPGDEYIYYLPGIHQNVLAELDGDVYVPQVRKMRDWYGSRFFPLPLHGMRFEALLEEVRAAARGESVQSSSVVAGRRFAC